MKKYLKYIAGALIGIAATLAVPVLAATVLFPSGGGTGTSTPPTLGQVLVGNSNGTYSPQATSTLGIISGGTPGGSSGQVQYNNNGAFGATTTFAYATSTNTLTIKAKTGQSSNIFQGQDSSATNQFYLGSNGTANFGNNPVFHNIAASSLVALNGSNALTGINTLTNIVYSSGASALSAVPSGSATDFQFQNNSGLFDGNSHATIDLSGSFASTFSGVSNSPGTPGSFTPTITYSNGSFTTGYSTNSQTFGYKLFAEKISPADNSKYYSPTPATYAGSDNNSSIYASAASTISQTYNYGSGNYTANGQNTQYELWSYETVNGNTVYSSTTANFSGTDDSSSNPYTITITWTPPTFDPGATATGYILQRNINFAGFNDYTTISGGSTSSYTDDGSNSGWNISQTPTLTPTSVPNFYQVPITWTSVTGATNYKLFYSPNDFSPIYTGSPGTSPSVNFGSSGYNNNSIQYQVYFYQTIQGTNIFSSYASGSASDSSNTNFGVDMNLTPPSVDPHATASGFLVIRNVDGAGFNSYIYQSSTFTDTNSGWTNGTPVTTPTFGYLQYSIETGLVTSFTDTGSVSWTNDYTNTPTQTGPFGATIGGPGYGLDVSGAGIVRGNFETTGSIKVNSAYTLPTVAPASSGYFLRANSTNTSNWQTAAFTDITGTLAYSQLPLSSIYTGNILLSSGSYIGPSGAGTLDYGSLYQTLRAPTVLAYASGLQLGTTGGAYWQFYAPGSSYDLSAYNLAGSYGEWLKVSNTNRDVTFDGRNVYVTNGSLNVGSASPDASAILEATSTTKGFLPPKMTTTQKNAISSPAEGLIVYDTTLHQPYYYATSTWSGFGSGGGGGGSGTVTSVAASGGTTGLSFSGSPITTSGTLTLGGTLNVANGGTGNTSFTSGSIPYSNGTILTQDNSNLFWDSTNKRLGIATSSPVSTLSIVGNIFQNGSYTHFGSDTETTCSTFNCVELWGNDNTANGVQMGVGNRSAGSSAYSGFFLNNNLTDNTVTHYAFLGLNSSTYSDTSFGTAFAVPNQLLLQNTDGPVSFMASTSTSAGYISFLTNGAATTNEIARITSKGLSVSSNNWYSIGGNLLAYASTTNSTTVFGLNAGGNSATTTSSVGNITAIGYQALSRNAAAGISGQYNVAVGGQALFTNATGNNLTAVGYQALNLSTASNNTAIGYQAALNTSSGAQNTALGVSSLANNTTGTDNVAVGFNAGKFSGTGARNRGVFIGSGSGANLGTSNDDNTLVGYNSGNFITGAWDNTFLGSYSGQKVSTGNNNILVGYNALPPIGNSTSNQMSIGNFLFGTGLTATTSAVSLSGITPTGLLGVASTTPFATLSVAGTSGTDPLAVATSSQGTLAFGIDSSGHRYSGGPAPAVSSCGTSPSITGDDNAGTISVGSGVSTTACTITFAHSWAATPTCQLATDSVTALADISSISTSALTVGLGASLSSGHIYYECLYHHN